MLIPNFDPSCTEEMLLHYHGSTAESQQYLICYRPKQCFVMNYTPNLTPPKTPRKHRTQAKSFTLSKKQNIIHNHFQHTKSIKRRKRIMHTHDSISENIN